MNISIAQAVACHNILALKDFQTFLFNYQLHEKPNFLEKWLIARSELWRNRVALKFFNELRETELEKLTVKLKDCKAEMFAVLYIAGERKLKFTLASDLFQYISETVLEFDKIKTPTDEARYVGDKQQVS